MKHHHVKARLDKRGANRCQASCPGWVVRTTPGQPKLMACAACNALQPPRLQITDKMVKLLPSARDCLAMVAGQLRRARVERATTRHLRNPLGLDALCGHHVGRTLKGRRVHLCVLNAASANCNECVRLAAMTPAERDAEKQAASAALRVKFAGKREQAVRERQDRHAETTAAIAVARDEARVAMDIMEEVGFERVQLVINVIATPDKDPALVARATERVMLVENALDMEVVAHRHANPASRGERRWLFRNVNGTRDGRGSCDVACRFCDKVLLKRCTIGDDYTVATDDHTVRCALEYLGGRLPENLSDEEVVRR